MSNFNIRALQSGLSTGGRRRTQRPTDWTRSCPTDWSVRSLPTDWTVRSLPTDWSRPAPQRPTDWTRF
ncbi:hypothetical protein [Amycolatopsis palatopharyngis]|uniref:hypothetical protein n=1 Tax=Amycolatopsis palatopharyngis TaxID=187982 RepID=UPI000E256CAF|nr:hypothetical protein [Amycolatopsis palatopharyngis]